VFRPLGDQKVAGGVVTVAPIYAKKWTAQLEDRSANGLTVRSSVPVLQLLTDVF
jgi:hypothetical protein